MLVSYCNGKQTAGETHQCKTQLALCAVAFEASSPLTPAAVRGLKADDSAGETKRVDRCTYKRLAAMPPPGHLYRRGSLICVRRPYTL